MNLLSKTLLVAAISVAGLSAGKAAAQEMVSGTCEMPGAQYAFSGVPTDGNPPLPSTIKTIGAVTLLARQNSCNIQLVCVRASQSEADVLKQRNQCVAVRQAIVRSNKGGSFGRDNIFIHRTKPTKSYKLGNVYAILR